MRRKIKILNIEFDVVDFEKALSIIFNYLNCADSDKQLHIVTANPEIVMYAESNNRYRTIVNNAGLVVADGIGVVIASRILGNKLPMRVAGFDLISKLFSRLADQKVYLLGATSDVVENAAKHIQTNYPNVRVVGYHDGYFSDTDTNIIISDINDSKADILLVALGFPKQEFWINEFLSAVCCRIAVGVGGSFDVWAGKLKRAPMFWQKLGLEWLYRLLCQPSRWRRMLVLPLFISKVWFRSRTII